MKKLFYAILLSLPFGVHAQIKIGNNPSTIDPSSVLELEQPNKALYLSRVSLSSTTDVTTVPSPKAGMMVYNTNASIGGTVANPVITGGIGVYTYDGSRWVGASGSGSAANAWNLTGNSGTSTALNFIGTTDNNGLVVRTNNVQRALFRPDGTIAMGNGTPVYTSNLLEIPLQNVGGPITSGEQNQGVNVLASALNGSALSVGLRGRMNVDAGVTVNSARGVQGNVGVDGTANGGVTAGYYDAVLRSGGTLGSAATLTGVGVDVEATGGTSANTNAFIGGRLSANAANATAVRTYGGFNYAANSVTSNIGTLSFVNDPTFAKFINFRSALSTGYGAGIAAYNGANGDNQYAADLTGSNNSDNARTLNVTLNPAANSLAGAGNSGPFATSSILSYPGTENTGNFAGTLGGLYSNANTSASDYQAQGALLESATTGGTGAMSHAIGAFGLVTGNSTTADAKARIIGIGGATNFQGANNNFNGIAVNGYNAYDGTPTKGAAVGGHFDGTGGATEFGVIGTVGDVTAYQTMFDPALSTMHIGVAAVNHNPAGPKQLALYTEGAVQMKSLPSVTPAAFVAVDAAGNLGTTSIPSGGVTADNGLTKTGNNIQFGGSLLHNTSVAAAAFNTTFTGSNPATGASVVKVENNAGAVADGSDLFAAFNSINGTNANPVGNPGTLRAQYNSASTASNNMRVQGALNEASSTGQGLGSSATPQATGATGLADYNGSSDAPTTDYLVGLRGAAYTSSNKTNGLNVVGQNFGGSYYRSVGGYFYPNSGTDANLGIVAQTGGTDNSGWQASQFAGKNISVAAINTGSTANDFAGYFLSNNTASTTPALFAENKMTTNFTQGDNPFGAMMGASGTDGQPASGNPSVVTGVYPNASTTGDNVQTQAVLAEASTSGKGLGTTSNIAQVVGSFGLADYNGASDAGIDDYATGSAGSPYTSSKAINGIGITGSPYSSGYYRMIGGYFRAAGGSVDNGGYHHANIGMVSQVGGTKNQAWRDLTFNDKNIGVVAVNYNAASANDMALYTSGGVQMNNLGTTTATSVLGIDGLGNVSATSLSSLVTADNGLTKTGNNIQFGGSLLHNTSVAAAAFNTTFTGSNPATGASVVKVENNAGAVADGSDLFAAFNSINGTNANPVGNPGTLRAQYNSASTASNNMRVQGALNEASSTGQGLGSSATPQATGATGLADYNGSSDAPTTDYLVGLRGAAYTSSNKTNGLNVVGQNFGGSYYRSVGGYFYPNSGTDANLGIVAQTGGTDNSGWQASQFAGKNISVAAINTGSTANDFAGYFLSNNTASTTPALFAENKMTTNFTQGDNPFGAMMGASGTDGQPASGNPSVVTGVYPNASTTGDNVQTQAVLAEASTSGKGLGTTSNIAQVVGSFGLADYNGASDAGIDDYATGSAGSPYTSSKAINGIGITGSPYSSGYYRMIGGYFRAAGGSVDNGGYHHANIGMVSQVGGTKNQAWRDLTFNDKNIGVVAVNYNAASANDMALYTSGAVTMKNLTGTGTYMLTIDPTTGLVGSAPAGGSGSGWSLTGNAGTNPSTNFIGTTDAAHPLAFRVNGQPAGRIDADFANVFMGTNTAISLPIPNPTGIVASSNTLIGYAAGFGVATSSGNTAIGSNALFFTDGEHNTAVGFLAGKANTTGVGNLFLGYQADAASGTLTKSAAIGYNAKVAASNSIVLGGTGVDAVNVGIGTTTPLASLHVSGTDGIIIPAGTTAQQPATPQVGTIRFNTTTHRFEGYTDDINTTNATFPEPGWVDLSTN